MQRRSFLTTAAAALLSGCAGGGPSTIPSLGDSSWRKRPSPSPSPSPTGAPASPTPGPQSSALWWGVTIDNPSNVSGLQNALASLQTRSIARICFDAGTSPSDFTALISAISPNADMMGQPFDSSDVANTSQSAYVAGFQTYLSAFPNLAAWEVGNEINGNWLGTNPQAKAYAAWQLVHGAGKKTALTLYYEPPQTVTPGYDMIPWATANIPSDMKAGLDYVLVSYYETDNNNIRPTPSQWTTIFQNLQSIFPNSRLGFGEVGMDNPATSATLSQAENIMSYYYGLKPAVANWIGGFFWWYFAEDCVPTSKPLFGLLKSLV